VISCVLLNRRPICPGLCEVERSLGITVVFGNHHPDDAVECEDLKLIPLTQSCSAPLAPAPPSLRHALSGVTGVKGSALSLWIQILNIS
jgi:hypothetical protein